MKTTTATTYYNPPFLAKVFMLLVLLGLYKLNSPQSVVWKKTTAVHNSLKASEKEFPVTASSIKTNQKVLEDTDKD